MLAGGRDRGELGDAQAAPAPANWKEVQRLAFLQAAGSHLGSRPELADKLGVSERTLYRRLAEARMSGRMSRST